MIIKRKHAGQLLPNQREGFGPGMENNPAGESDTEDSLEWTEDSVDSGLAPERRSPDQRSDRRRGYRRVEDRDLISKAYEEANAILENAQAQGFQEGLQQAQEAIEELRESIAQLMNGREEALQSVAGEIGSLAVEVAARIIKTEVSCDETLVLAMVRDTIQKAGRNSKNILLKVNPNDSATIKKTMKDDPFTTNNTELIIMEDSAVDQGSCIVETNSGLIDASFSTQLSILRQLFGGSRNTEGG